MSDNANQPEEQAWQELLRQLRKQPVAPPRPFFYTRLQARLAEAAPSPSAPALPSWLRQPAYAAMLGLLMVVLHADSVSGHPSAERASHRETPEPLARPLGV